MKFDELVMLLESDEGVEVKRTYWDGAKKKLRTEYWYKDGKFNRTDGPAYQRWGRNGQKRSENYYINGKEMSKAEFDAYTKYNPEDRQTMNELDLPDF